MKWNPVVSAAAAAAYITGIALFLRFMESVRADTPDTLLDGVGFISLFVFSAAVMAFLFFYQPVLRLMEGRRAEAVSCFLATLGSFGVITAAVLAVASLQ